MIVALAVLFITAASLPITAGQYRLQAFSRLCQFICVSIITIALMQLYHPLLALLISIGVVCLSLIAVHVRMVRKMVVMLIQPCLTPIAQFVAKVSAFEYISDTRKLSDKVGVSSRDELHAIIRDAAFISEKDRRDIAAYIPLLASTVHDYMRPLDDIIAIQEDDVIGPLLLDELHSSGQHSFLVLSKSGAIRGTVKLTQLTESSKDVSQVQDIMDRHVVQIQSTTSVQEALNMLIQEQVWLGVVNDNDTRSIVTVHDMVSALLGKKPR